MDRKKKLVYLLVMCVFGMMFACTPRCMAASALDKTDFVWTKDGKEFDFYSECEKSGEDTFFGYIYDEKKMEHVTVKNPGDYSTSRNIKIGSKASKVLKQYGQAKRVTYKSTEKFHKVLRYAYVSLDTSRWKSYVQYNYKEKKKNYQIRFYFDKNSKVVGICYIYNLNKWHNYSNKVVKSGFSFKVPSGKKITTKTIGGKKVYVLPKGTVAKFDKAKANIKVWDSSVAIYDENGDCITGTGLGGGPYKDGDNLYNWEWNDLPKTSKKADKLLKSGKYRYLTVCFYDYSHSEKKQYAPEYIYFRFE